MSLGAQELLASALSRKTSLVRLPARADCVRVGGLPRELLAAPAGKFAGGGFARGVVDDGHDALGAVLDCDERLFHAERFGIVVAHLGLHEPGSG